MGLKKSTLERQSLSYRWGEFQQSVIYVTILLHGSPHLPVATSISSTNSAHLCTTISLAKQTEISPVNLLRAILLLLWLITCWQTCMFLICPLCLHPGKPTCLLSLTTRFALWACLSKPVWTLCDIWLLTSLLDNPSACSLWIHLPHWTVYLVLGFCFPWLPPVPAP